MDEDEAHLAKVGNEWHHLDRYFAAASAWDAFSMDKVVAAVSHLIHLHALF